MTSSSNLLPASKLEKRQKIFFLGGSKDKLLPNNEVYELTNNNLQIPNPNLTSILPNFTNNRKSESYKIGWSKAVSFYFNHTIYVCGGAAAISKKCLFLEHSLSKNTQNLESVSWLSSSELMLPELLAGAVTIQILDLGVFIFGGFLQAKNLVNDKFSLFLPYSHIYSPNSKSPHFFKIPNLKFKKFRHSCCYHQVSQQVFCTGGLKSPPNRRQNRFTFVDSYDDMDASNSVYVLDVNKLRNEIKGGTFLGFRIF